MKSKARITVYEHDRLTTDQASFKTRHLNALLKLNEYHNFDYFDHDNIPLKKCEREARAEKNSH